MKPLLWCTSILAAAYIPSRRAAEIIEPWSYCFWELEHAERPSVLGEVHGDEPTLFSHYLIVRSIYSPHRPKASLLSPHKAESLSAISASNTYHLCGSISSAALREKSDNQEQHWVCVTLYHLNILASAWLSMKIFGINKKVTKSGAAVSTISVTKPHMYQPNIEVMFNRFNQH